MKTRAITKLAVLGAALLIAGWSCGQKITPVASNPTTSTTDAGETSPADSASFTPPVGWQIYRTADFSVAYPGDLYVQQDVIVAPQPSDLVRVLIDDEPIRDRTGTDWIPDITVESWSDTFANALASFGDVTSSISKRIGDQDVTVLRYQTEMPLGETVVYLFAKGTKVFAVESLAGIDDVINTITAGIINSLEGI